MAGAGASAGDDSIVADGDASGDDVVAGDAQAISLGGHAESQATNGDSTVSGGSAGNDIIKTGGFGLTGDLVAGDSMARSEEHTSELQSLMRISDAVFCLKKKKK